MPKPFEINLLPNAPVVNAPPGSVVGPIWAAIPTSRHPQPPHRRRLGVTVLALCFSLLMLVPEQASAAWRRANDIFFGTAYTLPEKRMRIGVIAPLSYGVHERVTLSTHPILDLLLTPNAAVRIKLVDGRLTLSGTAAYTQSFFVDGDEPANGQVRTFGIASLPLTNHIIISITGGIAQELTEDMQTFESSFSTHFRIDQQNILMAQGAVSRANDGQNKSRMRALLMYAYAFPTFKAGAGLAMGEMAESLGSIPFADDARVVPYIDIWWSF